MITSFSARLEEIMSEKEKRDMHLLLLEAAEHWKLTELEVFSPGGFSAVVVSCERNGEGVVLKIPREGRVSGEADALGIWNGEGAVILRDQYKEMLLLERVRPGSDISLISDSAYNSNILCLLPLLHVTPPIDHAFPTVFETADKWEEEILVAGDEIERSALANYLALIDPISGHDVLLHGDLHPENILLQEKKFIAIDPIPLVGEGAFEIEPLLRRYLDQDNLESARELVEATGYNPRSVIAYTFLRSAYYRLISRNYLDAPRVKAWEKRISLIGEIL
jgi:streptomycin 6-kinase